MDVHLFLYTDQLFLRNNNCLDKMASFQLIRYEERLAFIESDRVSNDPPTPGVLTNATDPGQVLSKMSFFLSLEGE